MSRVVQVKPRMEGGAVVVDVDTFTGTRLGTAVCGNQHTAYTGAHELAEGLEQAFDVAIAAGLAIVTGAPLEVAKKMLATWYEAKLDEAAKAAEEAAKPAEPAEPPAPNPATVEDELRAKVAELEAANAKLLATSPVAPAPEPAPVPIEPTPIVDVAPATQPEPPAEPSGDAA